MTRTTPELAPSSPSSIATPTGGRLATTNYLACNRPHTRRIFSGIGFRACGPPPTNSYDDNSESDEVIETSKISNSDAFECFAKGLMWLEQQTGSDSTELMLLKQLGDRAAKRRQS
ncbi:hypothetical protein AVEN_238233-1 [Araneus ventricosus]|uniref:Uncharacterized protein n=1 Tax=Araneus ventricosus TaxID=182803 RepID=A0A4Y2PN36_ARAVE|nr:hypothetical protein AVEN_238233-1 [Araneus ventricosus]